MSLLPNQLPIDTRSHSLQWKLLRLEVRHSSRGRMGACTAYTNVFLKCWVSAFCTIMEMCFATFDGFQKLLPFQHVVPTSSSHMKSCNFYLLSFSVSCMSRTFFNPFWLWPSMAIYGPYKLGIHREQYVGNLVGLISQFFCMELRGPRRSLTGQETPPS